MPETNQERLGLIKESDIRSAIIDLAKKKPWPDPFVDEITKDVAWLIEQAERVSELESNCRALTIEWRDGVLENKRLRESLKELTIQENAIQAHYSLAHKNMRMYKKFLDEITSAMNTERPAEEKTRDIREVLNSVK